MVMLTIEGLKTALTYVHDNSKTIKYYEAGSKKGLIVTEGMSEDEAYHLRVVELLQPKLTTKLSESFTALSLAGQELLDILRDEAYIASLSSYLNKQGYTHPSDRQVFRLLCERMSGESSKSWQDMFSELVSDIGQAATKEEVTDIQPEEPLTLELSEENTQSDEAHSVSGGIIEDTKKRFFR